jgi:hypothetical protein
MLFVGFVKISKFIYLMTMKKERKKTYKSKCLQNPTNLHSCDAYFMPFYFNFSSPNIRPFYILFRNIGLNYNEKIGQSTIILHQLKQQHSAEHNIEKNDTFGAICSPII